MTMEESHGELIRKISHLHTEDEPSSASISSESVALTTSQSSDVPMLSQESDVMQRSSVQDCVASEPGVPVPSQDSDITRTFSVQDDVGSEQSAAVLPQITETELQHHQEQRTLLRERFLRMLNNIWDVPIAIRLYNQKDTVAKFACSDVDILHMQVRDLQTPLGVMPFAMLRTSDVISYSLELPQ